MSEMSYAGYVLAAYLLFVAVLLWDFIAPRIRTRRLASDITAEGLGTTCALTGETARISGQVVLVGARHGRDLLLHALRARQAEWADAGIRSVTAIGDANAPGMLVHAVFAGHLYARDMDAIPDPDAVPFRRDLPQ